MYGFTDQEGLVLRGMIETIPSLQGQIDNDWKNTLALMAFMRYARNPMIKLELHG